jgi:hypothetical protein
MSNKSKLSNAIKSGRVIIVLKYLSGADEVTVERPVITTALENYNGAGTDVMLMLRAWPEGQSGEVRASITLADYQRAKSDPTLLNGLPVYQFRMRGPKIISHMFAVR